MSIISKASTSLDTALGSFLVEHDLLNLAVNEKVLKVLPFEYEHTDGKSYLGLMYKQANKIIETSSIFASDAAESDIFGTSVAISGNRVLVGAHGKDAGGLGNSGQVYVYEWNSGTGKYDEIQKLTASDPAAGDNFGHSVAISGNRVLVGATYKDAGGIADSGQVYVYEWNSGTSKYVEIQKLTASDPSASDAFGVSVAISGNRVLVGAHLKNAGGITDSGQVYVYEWNSGTSKYVEIQKFSASDPSASDQFGSSVAISGNRVLVGAYLKDAVGIVDSGQVYVYEWNSGTSKYDEIQKLTASDPFASDFFGRSVAISGTRVLVGAPFKGAGGMSDSGQVYVYEWNSGTGKYDEIQKLNASDAAWGDIFGTSVAISGNRVLVGASYKNAGGIVDSGQVYVLDVDEYSESLFTTKTNDHTGTMSTIDTKMIVLDYELK